MIYTGIGSRETPLHIQEEMTAIATHLFREKWLLRSGHAVGADQAFEKGTERFVSYLPWFAFNKADMKDSRYRVPPAKDWMRLTVTDFHPAPQKLSTGAYRMMLRNACQVLGDNGQRKSDVVICWTPNAGGGGGTGQAIRIAKANNIPVIDMADSRYCTKDLVLARLKSAGLL